MQRTLKPLWALLLLLPSACGSLDRIRGDVRRGWHESEFGGRPVVEHTFVRSADPERLETVIGEPTRYTIRRRDTLLDVARHYGLGLNEVQDALPELDPWVPTTGKSIDVPTWWVLPDGPDRGVIVNLSEMRLYYFPEGRPVVVTYPVGLGRDDRKTPIGRFRIGEKTVNPTWVIPASIRAERLREEGRTETQIPGGDPENPLGRYRMRLGGSAYGIHGTNVPWGVGMQVSHGCIRLYPEDIEVLFPLVPEGTPVELVDQPVKVGARDGDVYVEVHHSVYNDRFDYRRAARRLIARKGWTALVDWKAVELALERKTGVPTRVSSRDAVLARVAADPGRQVPRTPSR